MSGVSTDAIWVYHALRELGVVKGDRVTLALGNSVEYLVAAFGVLKSGAVLHPINPALGSSELGYILGHAAPRAIGAPAAVLNAISDALAPFGIDTLPQPATPAAIVDALRRASGSA